MWEPAAFTLKSTHHIKVSYLNIKSKAHFPKLSLCCSCSLTKSPQGLRWRSAALPTYSDPNSWRQSWRPESWNPRSKKRNMLRSTWWWTHGCREHCQSPSDLPKSRESGPGRGACLLAPVPWETEIWDMSLPIISFTEKQEKGEWLVTAVWLPIWCSMASSTSKTFFPSPWFSVKVNAVL